MKAHANARRTARNIAHPLNLHGLVRSNDDYERKSENSSIRTMGYELRIGSDTLESTHEFLAPMLRVQRAGVTVALQHLESKAIIGTVWPGSCACATEASAIRPATPSDDFMMR
jgi:hypothetical protein